VWVNGKTGGRWLIAKHRAVDVLRRLHARQADIKHMDFEDVLKTRTPTAVSHQQRLSATQHERYVQAIDA
jgi:hypothetical protein